MTEEIKETLPEEQPAEPGRKAATVIGVIMAVLFVLLSLLECVCISVSFMNIVFAAAVILICTRLPKFKFIKNGMTLLLAVILIGSFFLFLFPPLTVESHARWKYPLQKMYLSLYGYREPEWFPDFDRIEAEEFTFNYMPSVMQGTGHFCVELRTSPETAAAFEAQYAQQAVKTLPMTDYSDSTAADEQGRSLSVYTGDFWDRDHSQETGCRIYVLSSNWDWNHPHTSAVLVDASAGKIQFSQLG